MPLSTQPCGALTKTPRWGEGPRPPPRAGTRRAARAALAVTSEGEPSLELDGGAGLLELRAERLRLLLADALLDRLRGVVDELLGFLEPEPGRRSDHLDHVDLLVSDAREHDVELRLLLRRRGAVARGHRGGSRSGDGPDRAAKRGGEEPDNRVQRADDRAEHLALERFGGGQRS